MQRNPVRSSLIEGVGYDPGTKVLQIEFKKGGVWEFFDVPPQLHEKFIKAESIGKFFSKHIKGNYIESRFG